MKKIIIVFTIIAFLFSACDHSPTANPPNGEPDNLRTIIDVIDGDTVKLDGGETVRLVGVDTPEMNSTSPNPPEPCAPEATAFTDSCANGHKCYLVYNTSVGDSVDWYGRTLAFVHLWPESTCLNVEIVRYGWSLDWDDYPVRTDYEVLFEDAEVIAAAAHRGIWNPTENCD